MRRVHGVLLVAILSLPAPARGQVATDLGGSLGNCPPIDSMGPDTSDRRLAPPAAGFLATNGVRLHYLDWGGEGEPIVLLTGMGSTAHTFDEFAPCFTSTHRVVGLTRRGFGTSSKVDTGYDRSTLARDILGAIDELGFDRVILLGASIASGEMTRFATMYPERTAGLVYLDAAYDRLAARDEVGPSPGGFGPGPEPDDLVSLGAFREFLTYRYGVPSPETEVRALYRVEPDGRVAESIVNRVAYDQMIAHRESPDYSGIRAPALSIYVTPNPPEVETPWLDSATQAEVRVWQAERLRPYYERQLAQFGSIPGSCVKEVRGRHAVYLSNREEVADLALRFLLNGEC